MPKSIARRAFLQSAALAGGAALTGRYARLYGAQADSPAERVRVAVMGLNGRGSALVRRFADCPGVSVVGLCDVDAQVLQRAASELREQLAPEASRVADFRRLLDDPQVDALVVATPDHWHAPATILACAAGKHVYVEKPASHNPQEGEWMIRAARRDQRVVQLGTQRRSSPEIRSLIARLHAGEIGPVRYARAWINSRRPSIGQGREVPPPAHLDYTLWQGPAPERPYRDNLIHYRWHWFWHWGTGELGNNGVHMLDLARWGLVVDRPDRVSAGGGKWHFDDDQQTPDTQFATFDFAHATITWEHRTWHHRGIDGQTSGVVFYGEQGSCLIGDGEWFLEDADGNRRDSGKIQRGEPEHVADFVDAVRTGRTPQADIEEGVKSTLLCHLGNIAYRTGRVVQLDANTGRPTDDDEQMKLWSRDYRTGWEIDVTRLS